MIFHRNEKNFFWANGYSPTLRQPPLVQQKCPLNPGDLKITYMLTFFQLNLKHKNPRGFSGSQNKKRHPFYSILVIVSEIAR